MVDEKEVGPYRVWKADEDVPGIAISRSMGDLIAHEIGVSAEPEVTAKDIDTEDKFIVMGSDGVWDVMSSAEAVGFILSVPITEKETAPEKMVNECRDRWDLLNEIKRKQAQIMLDNSETNKKAAAERKNELERNIACDDITVAVHYLTVLEQT
jgi:integrin-linked kinase-associated serine/threonine phosphatase 2C